MTQKKKILLLSDHPLSTSGVGTQARWLVNGLISTGKYSFRCLGGAMKHENYEITAVNPDFVVKPVDGFGDRNLLRVLLATEKPDALMLFTDPRFFVWVWEMADEIRQVCPILYNHLWDNPPWPEFNRALYESNDLINCINYPTYEMVKERFPEKTNFIPHAVPEDLYKPMPEEEVKEIRRKILGNQRADHFIGLFVSRNARRKMPSDIIASWKIFLDRLEAKHGHRNATLMMHCDPLDQEGPNLHHVVDLFDLRNNVVFSKDRVNFAEMSGIYNSADVILNKSCNEGFGLSVLEGIMCGKPVVAIKTGGITRQIVNHETGEQHGVALDPEVRTLVGNQMVPYIYEDFVSNETYADAILKMYEMGKDKRKELGFRAREYALNEFSMKGLVEKWDASIEKSIDVWKNNKNLWEVVTL